MFQKLITLFRKSPFPSSSISDDKKIKILIELASFDKGGLEKVVLDSAVAFNREKFQVFIVTLGKVGHLGEVAQSQGVEVFGLSGPNKSADYLQLLKQLRIDVAISHFSDSGYKHFFKLGIPNITFIHNVYAFFSKEQTDAFAHNDKYVSRYISVSKNATRYAVHKLGVAAEKIVTVPNGLIIAEHEERMKKTRHLDRVSLGIAAKDYVFANVAAYNLHKGHYLMAHAMQILLKTRQDVKILCVGNVVYPPHLEDLKKHLKAMGVDKHIILTGYISEVADVHDMSDAFLLPSFIEGWSIAMNEAMFYEKPMILTDTGASAEVIESGDIGILLPNEYGDTIDLTSTMLDSLAYAPRHYLTASKLADAMNEMASNRVLWKQKGKGGRAKIYRSFDFVKIVEEYELIITEVLALASTK
jgi:glycosyltransferase involved in cell wall biosynthesis